MASELKIAVALPQSADGDDIGAAVTRGARRAEELGFAGLWTLDGGVEPPIGQKPVIDGLHALSFAAAVTSRAELGISVIVMPRRNPVLLAKELASIDRLSGGRLVVGVGLGRKPDEQTGRLGFPTNRHVSRLEEGVQAMRAIWSQDEAAFSGRVYDFDGLRLEPKPAQRPGPPVWFGARARPALQRVVRIGDGWMGAGSSSMQDFFEQSKILDEELDAAGRATETLPRAKRVYIAVEDDRQTAFDRLVAVLDPMYQSPGMTERCGLYGPAEHCASELRKLVDAGAGELLLHQLYDHDRQLEALAGVAELVRA
jgi:probable F420-dependent oxidoreductase